MAMYEGSVMVIARYRQICTNHSVYTYFYSFLKWMQWVDTDEELHNQCFHFCPVEATHCKTMIFLIYLFEWMYGVILFSASIYYNHLWKK